MYAAAGELDDAQVEQLAHPNCIGLVDPSDH